MYIYIYIYIYIYAHTHYPAYFALCCLYGWLLIEMFFLRFPPDGQRKPFDSVQHVVTRGPNNFIAG